MKDRLSGTKEIQLSDMQNYYRFQAKIYDLTRWIFLFGRNAILNHLPFEKNAALRILDVGCGTGINSDKMARKFPNARITALDVSPDMLERAREKLGKYGDRVEVIHRPYEKNQEYAGQFDLILFSYALTMINPQWSELVEQAQYDLKPEGCIAVVDFHGTRSGLYKKFMRSNHVRLDGHLIPALQTKYNTVYKKVTKGYLGVWEYMMFVGKKK